MDLTQIERRSLVMSLRARILAQCCSLFTSTMWTYDSIISLLKFEDDAKIGNTVLTDEDRQNLQEDLHKTLAWSDRLDMPFNEDRCQVLQARTGNKRFDYEMRGVNSKPFNGLRTWGSKSRQTSNSHINASIQQIKRTECWAS